jgi:DNA polymerase III subunit epsilon
LRQIVLDTETTGRSPDQGDRLVEIGCIEIVELTPTGRTFHCYVNPQRDVPEEVVQVHGLTGHFLSQHKTFDHPDVCDRLLEFLGDAPLIAHNSEFDRRFLNAELARLGREIIPQERFTDTLALARKRFPGAANSLDALSRRFQLERYGFDLVARKDKHGALLDARMLAEIYLQLQGGREQRLAFAEDEKPTESAEFTAVSTPTQLPRPVPLASRILPEELAAHAAFIAELGDKALWVKLSAA